MTCWPNQVSAAVGVALPCVSQSQAREAAMQVQAAVLTAQNIHLRRELGSGWAAADSNIIQVQPSVFDVSR